MDILEASQLSKFAASAASMTESKMVASDILREEIKLGIHGKDIVVVSKRLDELITGLFPVFEKHALKLVAKAEQADKFLKEAHKGHSSLNGSSLPPLPGMD